MILAVAVDRFMKDRASYCSDKTLQVYASHLDVFYFWIQNTYGKSLQELDFKDFPEDDNILQNYILYLRKDYRNVTNTTIRSYVRPVKALLRYCYEEDYCKDYLKGVKLPKDDAVPPVPLLQEEVEQLDAAFDLETMSGIRNYCIVHLMLDCGLRSQEVLHLQVTDVDAAHHILHIRLTKECKSRITMIPEFLVERIREYIAMSGHDSGLVFRDLRSGEPMTHNAIKQLFAKLKKQAQLPRLHAHLLRHTFGTSYLVYGGNLEFLRVLMGHSDYNVTKGYVSMAAQYRMLGVQVYRLDDIFYKFT